MGGGAPMGDTMTVRQIVQTLALLALLVVVAGLWHVAHAQASARDSTVCAAFRTRTGTNGAIVSTSVAKVACGGTGRVDTVTVVRVDTVKVPVVTPPAPMPIDPRGYNCWQARDATNPTCIPDAQAVSMSNTLVLRAYGMTFGYVRWLWHGVITATDPSLTPGPTPGPPVHDTTTVTRYLYWQPVVSDSIRWRSATASASAPAAVPVPHDTVRVPVPTPSPGGTVPELPRVFLDTRMPVMPLNGDTLYQVSGVTWCRGPTCAATRAAHQLPVQVGAAPPIPVGATKILTGPNPAAVKKPAKVPAKKATARART